MNGETIKYTGGEPGANDYMLLNEDVSYLPKNQPTGSSAYVIDKAEVYIFEETTNKWYKQ